MSLPIPQAGLPVGDKHLKSLPLGPDKSGGADFLKLASVYVALALGVQWAFMLRRIKKKKVDFTLCLFDKYFNATFSDPERRSGCIQCFL